jgi:hypothetical protein
VKKKKLKKRNLTNLDLFSYSDPICTLFILDEDTSLYFEMERTEMVKDDLNPIFSKSILINSELKLFLKKHFS